MKASVWVDQLVVDFYFEYRARVGGMAATAGASITAHVWQQYCKLCEQRPPEPTHTFTAALYEVLTLLCIQMYFYA